MAVRYCRNCGKPIADTDRFCSYCGARIIREEAPAEEQAPERTVRPARQTERPAGTTAVRPGTDARAERAGGRDRYAYRTPEEIREEAEKLKKNFKAPVIDWDLSGYPDQEAHRKTEDVAFSWSESARPEEPQKRSRLRDDAVLEQRLQKAAAEAGTAEQQTDSFYAGTGETAQEAARPEAETIPQEKKAAPSTAEIWGPEETAETQPDSAKPEEKTVWDSEAPSFFAPKEETVTAEPETVVPEPAPEPEESETAAPEAKEPGWTAPEWRAPEAAAPKMAEAEQAVTAEESETPASGSGETTETAESAVGADGRPVIRMPEWKAPEEPKTPGMQQTPSGAESVRGTGIRDSVQQAEPETAGTKQPAEPVKEEPEEEHPLPSWFEQAAAGTLGVEAEKSAAGVQEDAGTREAAEEADTRGLAEDDAASAEKLFRGRPAEDEERVEARAKSNVDRINEFYRYSRQNEEYQELLEREYRSRRPSPAAGADRTEEVSAEEPKTDVFVRPPVYTEVPTEEAGTEEAFYTDDEPFAAVVPPSGTESAEAPESAPVETEETLEAEAGEPEDVTPEGAGSFGEEQSEAPVHDVTEAPAAEASETPETPEETAMPEEAAAPESAAETAEEEQSRYEEAIRNLEKELQDAQKAAEDFTQEIELDAIREAAQKKETAQEETRPEGVVDSFNIPIRKEEPKGAFEEAADVWGEPVVNPGRVQALESGGAAGQAAAAAAGAAAEAAPEEPAAEEPAFMNKNVPGSQMTEERRKDFDAVFGEEEEEEKRHPVLKFLAVLLILLILVNVVVIALKWFAPDSSASIWIQELYNRIFSAIGG